MGLSTPVEGAIQRTQGIITRWELPIPVYVAPSIVGDCAAEAMDYWQSVTGLPFVVVGADAEPRITVRAAGSDELNIASGSGFVYRTDDNNRARLAVVKILTSSATCTPPSTLFRHELGHAIGIFTAFHIARASNPMAPGESSSHRDAPVPASNSILLESIGLVGFRRSDLRRRVRPEPIENPFGPKVLPMYSE